VATHEHEPKTGVVTISAASPAAGCLAAAARWLSPAPSAHSHSPIGTPTQRKAMGMGMTVKRYLAPPLGPYPPLARERP
jgi:hypothetical protein